MRKLIVNAIWRLSLESLHKLVSELAKKKTETPVPATAIRIQKSPTTFKCKYTFYEVTIIIAGKVGNEPVHEDDEEHEGEAGTDGEDDPEWPKCVPARNDELASGFHVESGNAGCEQELENDEKGIVEGHELLNVLFELVKSQSGKN